MSDEEYLLACYSAMTPWARNQLLDSARHYAKTWPAKVRPHLHLVSVPSKEIVRTVR